MSKRIFLNGELLCGPEMKRLQQQMPDGVDHWIARTLIEYLNGADEESRCHYISIAWLLDVLRDRHLVKQLAEAFGSVCSTSDRGIDTAIINLCYAKLALLDGDIPKHNTHCVWAIDVLRTLPEFKPRGYAIAERILNEMLFPDEPMPTDNEMH